MFAAHLRLSRRSHDGASRAITHPLRYFQQADSTAVLACRMQHCTRTTIHHAFDRHCPAEPRMPEIDNLQLDTMSILSCGCTIPSGSTRPSAINPPTSSKPITPRHKRRKNQPRRSPEVLGYRSPRPKSRCLLSVSAKHQGTDKWKRGDHPRGLRRFTRFQQPI